MVGDEFQRWPHDQAAAGDDGADGGNAFDLALPGGRRLTAKAGLAGEALTLEGSEDLLRVLQDAGGGDDVVVADLVLGGRPATELRLPRPRSLR